MKNNMVKEQVFYRCPICGNIFGVIENSQAVPVCCGQPMHRMVPGETEGAYEKHLPVIETDGNKVTVHVGSFPHPMTAEHSIRWIYLHTSRGGHRVVLKPDDSPQAVFTLNEHEIPLAAYCYCNIHGLWKTEIIRQG